MAFLLLAECSFCFIIFSVSHCLDSIGISLCIMCALCDLFFIIRCSLPRQISPLVSFHLSLALSRIQFIFLLGCIVKLNFFHLARLQIITGDVITPTFIYSFRVSVSLFHCLMCVSVSHRPRCRVCNCEWPSIRKKSNASHVFTRHLKN